MEISLYQKLKNKISNTEHGYLIKKWQDIKPCDNEEEFFRQYAWVVINTGLKNQVAQKIYDRMLKAINEGKPIGSAYGNERKASSIEHIYQKRIEIFQKFIKADDKLKFLEGLPQIGKVTKYHLARNLGMDVCKPDRHLVRIADQFNTTPYELCNRLSLESGDRIGVVDYVLWRAANLNWL